MTTSNPDTSSGQELDAAVVRLNISEDVTNPDTVENDAIIATIANIRSNLQEVDKLPEAMASLESKMQDLTKLYRAATDQLISEFVDNELLEELDTLPKHAFLKTTWKGPMRSHYFPPIPISVLLGRFWYVFSGLVSPWTEARQMTIAPYHFSLLLPDYYAQEVRALKKSTWSSFNDAVVEKFSRGDGGPTITESVMFFCHWVPPSTLSYIMVIELLALDIESTPVNLDLVAIQVAAKRIVSNFEVPDRYNIQYKLDDYAYSLKEDDATEPPTNTQFVQLLRSFTDHLPLDIGFKNPRQRSSKS
ncbi:hypothetical protein CJU90_6619 [Yarrowia sp. C11]|nr:hypothetical protein CJU90_6619 [Yarrowia sp. C11]KAG5358730.1 hypothetical protein CKK34_4996 [Yarrowia sp. E02]